MYRPGLMNLWHVSKKTHGNITLAWGIRSCCMPFYFFCPTSLFILWRILYIYTSDCVQTVYALPLLLNNTASETLLHQSGVVLFTEWVFMTGALAGSDMANTWHWTKHFIVPSINRWPKSLNQNWVSIPYPVQRWLQCFCYHLMVGTKYFCSHSLLFCEWTVNTFCHRPMEGNNKCLHTEVKIMRYVTKIYTLINWTVAFPWF